jgi:hypothetical protein
MSIFATTKCSQEVVSSWLKQSGLECEINPEYVEWKLRLKQPLLPYDSSIEDLKPWIDDVFAKLAKPLVIGFNPTTPYPPPSAQSPPDSTETDCHNNPAESPQNHKSPQFLAFDKSAGHIDSDGHNPESAADCI